MAEAEVIGNAQADAEIAAKPWAQCLAGKEKVEVREKASAIEAITAMLGQEFEMANKYKVFDDGGDNELFFAAEQSGCCQRQMKQCLGDCAPWSVKVLYTEGGANEEAFSMDRPCTWTCCCFNRPQVAINAGDKTIGYIQDPWTCIPGNMTFTLKNGGGDPVLKAGGGCCQWGLCCPLPCGPCAEVNFDVTDASSGSEVGHLQKRVPGCCTFCFAPDVDNYKIDFGKVQTPELKALLIGLAIFIDFRYFNDNRNDNVDKSAD